MLDRRGCGHRTRAAPPLFDEFTRSKREAEATSVFACTPGETGGRFPLTGAGDVNTYALFAELFATMARKAGAIVPTGIATDATTAPFFVHLIEKQRLAVLIDFENRDAIFPAVHRSYKFSLLALSERTKAARFSFFLTNTAQVSDEHRRFTLSPREIAAINPNTRTAPVFRSKSDAELTKQIYARVPALIDDSKSDYGNPWNIDVHSRFIHLTEDAGQFRRQNHFRAVDAVKDGCDYVVAASNASSDVVEGRWVPLNEGEFGFQYDHRFATAEDGRVRECTVVEKSDRSFEITPTYWVHIAFFEERLRRRNVRTRSHLLGARRVSRNTDERTIIAAALPFTAVTYGWILSLAASARDSAVLLAQYNALVVDFCLRNNLSQPSIPQGVFCQTPVLPPSAFTDADLAFIVPRVLELTYASHAMKPFADDLGYNGNAPFPWNEDRRALLRAELDARIARLYGLTRDQLRYILDPADVMGPSYPSETFRVLKKNEMERYGEYRTRRLVLEAWDREESE